MPQSPTSQSTPLIAKKANGINDFQSCVKLEPGFVTFSLNMNAESDTWDRRHGRDFNFLGTGPVLGIFTLVWDDGTFSEIAQFNSELCSVT